MKILFFMRHPGYVRNFESTLRLLAEHGHKIHIAFEMHRRNLPSQETLVAGIEQIPGITHGPAPAREHAGWVVVARQLRRAVDYLRFLEPEFRDSPKLRMRAESRVPQRIRVVAGTLVRTRVGRNVARRVLDTLEHAVPISPSVTDFIAEHQPDVVLVTPLLGLGSPQADYVRQARAMGHRCGLCVASWDNLTVKGVIHDAPDLVTVWNELQREEAIRLHRIPADRVVSTGAQSYDHWFDWRPALDRERFCAQVGLPADRPFVLYVCSSPFIAPDEAPFVLEWIRRLREDADPRVSRAGVLVRPHPQHAGQWKRVDVDGLEAVAVWPRAGADPVDVETRSGFFDSMNHSAAIVGVNTSAMIEGAIVGRPVYTLLASQFEDTQRGVPHFSHLVHADRGAAEIASDFREHFRQLQCALDGTTADNDRRARFLETFVRPHGLDHPATPKLVAAIEELGRRPRPAPERPGPLVPLVRYALKPLAESEARRESLRLAERGTRRQHAKSRAQSKDEKTDRQAAKNARGTDEVVNQPK